MLVQLFDDKEEKVKACMDTHHVDVKSLIGMYKGIVKTMDENCP